VSAREDDSRDVSAREKDSRGVPAREKDSRGVPVFSLPDLVPSRVMQDPPYQDFGLLLIWSLALTGQ
jgi:hypothetical protein